MFVAVILLQCGFSDIIPSPLDLSGCRFNIAARVACHLQNFHKIKFNPITNLTIISSKLHMHSLL